MTRAGSYRMLSVLAQTPHSRMYVAEDAGGRKVALKELLFAAVPTLQQLEAFEREGRLLLQLEHPRIPRVVDSFKEGEGTGTRFYLAQELVEGESLWQRLHAGTFDEPQARDVAAQVLDVLAYLHGRTPRVIHRDVKPHNLIARPDGVIALVDFGAARELASGVTHQATLVGTYGYMPPDQLAGTVDPTCDLYALGATLMHLLTGRPPEKLVNDDLELGAAVSFNVSAEFARFVRKLAAKAHARRFPTAEAAAAALKALPPVQPRARRLLPGWPRAWVATAAAVAGAALFGTVAGVVWKLKAPAAETVAAQAGAPVKVWVWEPKAQVFETANLNSAAAGKFLPIGTELKVDHDPSCGAPFLQMQPPYAGFVRAGDVRTTAPVYEAVFESSRHALGEAKLADAEAEAGRAHALRPGEREPLALLLALFDAEQRPDDARRANDLLKALGPPPAAPPARAEIRTGPEPLPGERWFTGASLLRLRKKPSPDARVLAELSINSEVKVVLAKGDWAEVTWTREGVAQDLTLGQLQDPEELAAEEVQGFVAQAYLVKEKVDQEWTLAKAADAEKQGDAVEAERQLARAAAIDPVNHPFQLRLAKAAVAVRDYQVAAGAAVAASELSRGAAEPLVEMKLAYRCRGDRNRAEWIDDSASVKNMPEDACIESLAQEECEPCDCGTRRSPEEEDPLEEHRRREGARRDKLDAIDDAFPVQSWLRVKVRGPARIAPDMSRM
ncbi:MAG TPA: serine/threonine-protein kinase, partial [Myxococcales bacterium]|nr:serine/threonine-protein kinase [Myxococcales bacterium]